MQGVSFAVIHFNNGLHGWGYTEAQFKSGFPVFLQAIRALPGRGKLSGLRSPRSNLGSERRLESPH